MKLYIYSTLDGELFDEMEVERYDGEAVHGDFGTMSLSAELEYSSREDLNETLRADWRRAHPSAEALMTAHIASLEGLLLDTQLALCDVYEIMLGGVM